MQESSQALEQREKQIVELKSLSLQTSQSVHNDYERKLHDTVAKHEQEKFDMQKKHTESIQDLLEDTNRRIQKIESEYKAQLNQQVIILFWLAIHYPFFYFKRSYKSRLIDVG